MLCAACSSENISVISSPLSALVSSDCRPWSKKADFFQCRDCGAVGKVDTPSWTHEIGELYGSYKPYYQASGIEQKFRDRNGALRPRSDVLVDYLTEAERLGDQGKILDIGCGNGAFLKAFNKARPGWKLHGSDLGQHFKEEIEGIGPGARFFDQELKDIDETFEVITLIHCLEHVMSPVDFLRDVLDRLSPTGIVFIEVPNVAANLFDLLIFDHRSHFTPSVLKQVVDAAGLNVATLAIDWHPKEISLIASKVPAENGGAKVADPKPFDIARALMSLEKIAQVAQKSADDTGADNFAIFGTSIAATWLAETLEEKPAFFVDEDPARIGNTHFGKPILSPDEVGSDKTVFLPFVVAVAKTVERRFYGKFKMVTVLGDIS